MKILNLFAGLGGNRKTWSDHEITALEINPGICKIYSELYPNDTIITQDYEEYLRNKNNDLDFDLIWGSPPCQTHSHMQVFTRHNKKRQPIPKMDQVQGLALWLKRNTDCKFVIENVIPSYGIVSLEDKGIYHVVLDRHIFYSNFIIKKKKFRSRSSEVHGKISGLMRMDAVQLSIYHDLPLEIIEKVKGLQETGHDHLKVLRNLCDYQIGDYILKQSLKKNNLIKILK